MASFPVVTSSASPWLTEHRPHLGASTVEAQENVSKDVCTEVVKILSGGLPKAAVNAPIIMPEEYRKLQPFVRLVERMGNLYTQHFAGSRGGMVGGRRFELRYHGELAGVTNTRPLLAALVKGLTSSISDSGGRDVNMVNAKLIAKEKGIAISEVHAAETRDLVYASLVTLRSYVEGKGEEAGGEQVIEGYVSGQGVYISRLDRFTASFVAEGTMVLLHNYDEPGKIGAVGLILASHRVNINFMQVASVAGVDDDAAKGKKGPKEALMILGVDGEVTKEVLGELEAAEGILNVNLVRL